MLSDILFAIYMLVFYERNGIAVHVHQLQHSIDWESDRVRMTACGY